ncbi:hypothetical protein [Actinokineospora globicatena]|uniref:hypothetical protein n=1 Tax=Actinokineospora globicatena TaxID=103729 RepID=UPI0020A32B8D|nr:hypothetical protein [Actinokineospora globicatena]GLW81255.1 hypothetical protein Aglo01_57360 [Actinokineospora globicatena]GLW88047.1 hypothetical protein Aglo02_56860 [Actinokineospora globicatena]
MAEPEFTVVEPPRSIFRRKRFLGVFVPAGLIAVAGAIALFAGGVMALPLREVVVVNGRLASKAEFFADAEVRRILMAQGIQVSLDLAGSRDIAVNSTDGYDFVFPSGRPAALLIKQRLAQSGHRQPKMYKPFFSPIVLASYREYAEVLADPATGPVVTPQNTTGPRLYYDMPMDRFVDVVERGTTWDRLAAPNRVLPNSNRVLAQTSDLCSSNSSATYLGLVAFVANGNVIPQTEADAIALARKVKPLLTAQGLPAEDMAGGYLAPDGQGLAPIAVIYEHQYLAHQLRTLERTGRVDDRRVLLYPAAQVQTVPEFLALTPAGDRLGELIMTNPDLRRRALELGFRVFEADGSVTTGQFAEFLTAHGLPVPSSGISDTETFLPSLPLLEKMIAEIGECG